MSKRQNTMAMRMAMCMCNIMCNPLSCARNLY